jgi:S1-C subfamily serine protease
MKRQGLFIAVLLLIPAALQAQVIAYDFSALYQSAAPSVVLIASDSGTGSGFVVSPFGHVATNFHVIRNSKYLSVQFPDGRKVSADIIAVNSKYDMALLKVNSALVKDIKPLQLLPADREPEVRVGSPVVALGSPLNQRFLMTQGILSKVDDETLLGDFLLQPGNSGGPLLNMDGQVIGINTFGEGGFAGAVRIGTLRALLQTENIWESIAVEPSAKLLPALSQVRYPVDILNVKIQMEPLTPANYRFKAGDFGVTVITPVLIGKLQLVSQKIREENRHVRRGIKVAGEVPMLDDPYYEWHRVTEDSLDYAVTFDIRPNSGPRKRPASNILKSIFGRGGPRDMEFKGEFLEFRVYRDGELVEPIMPGRIVIQGKADDAKARFVDEAAAGQYVYSPDDFMTGNEFRIQVVDARKPNEVHSEVVFPATSPMIRQIRSDFSVAPDFLFVKVP